MANIVTPVELKSDEMTRLPGFLLSELEGDFQPRRVSVYKARAFNDTTDALVIEYVAHDGDTYRLTLPGLYTWVIVADASGGHYYAIRSDADKAISPEKVEVLARENEDAYPFRIESEIESLKVRVEMLEKAVHRV